MFFSRKKRLLNIFSLGIILVLVTFITPLDNLTLFSASANVGKTLATKKDPAIEQQIDVQDIAMSTTSSSYGDANGSGFFLWKSTRYASLQHVYFEAGIAKAGIISSTKRIRSADIVGNLVSGTLYKVRIRYSCSYNSNTNTFTETGSAELWSADNSSEITSSAVSNTINSGSGTCPGTPTTVTVRFSRLIILQADPGMITDTNTVINIGHLENRKLPDTKDDPLNNPKIWSYTDHTRYPTAGWDSMKDILFAATLASPKGIPVSACLYDITSNTEITCVNTTRTTPTYVTSSDIASLLTNGDQYETYLKVNTATMPVILYNSFVTVEQSNPQGVVSMELYYDFNPYPVSTSATTYGRGFFLNNWEPTNFNLPRTNEILSFHIETTESISQASSTGSNILFNTCSPNGGCGSSTVVGSNMDTTSTSFTRVRTADNTFAMPAGNELDVASSVKAGKGTETNNTSWLVINVNLIPNYSIHYITNVSYGPNTNEVMDECLPVGASTTQPGIVFIHGGGWGTDPETRTHYTTLCQSYASEGYVVYNIDYRLASSSPQTDNPWPDQIGDVQLAVRTMRANAQSLGLDPNRICAYGDSAGAHLSLLIGNMQTIYPSDVANMLANYSPVVNCVIDQFGPTDLTRLYNEVPADQTALYNLLDNETPTSDPTIYQNASPVTYVSSQSAQTLITQGTLDTMSTPPDQSQEIQQDLQQVNVPVQYMPYVGVHEYGGLSQLQKNVINDQINAYLLSIEHP